MTTPPLTAPPLTAETFDAARRGDREAILAVIDAAGPSVRRYARMNCASAADAEDAEQETLLAVFRQIGGLRSFTVLRIWLFTVVKRHCIRLARRAARLLVPLETAAEPSARAMQELRSALSRAIGALPPDQRAIVLRCELQGYKLDEAAADLGITRATAKARLHRARLELRAALAGLGG